MDEADAFILRAHEPASRVLGDAAVHDRLIADPRGYLDALDRDLRAIVDGRLRVTQPPKLLFDDARHGGDFRVMPCVLDDGERTFKTVKIVGTNRAGRVAPDQITVGQALVLDPIENWVAWRVDACLLSSARTAAVAALGVRRLGDPVAIGVLGAGRIGAYAAVLCGLDRPVRVADREPARAELAAAFARRRGVDAIAVPAHELRTVDALVVATTSTVPIVAAADHEAALVIGLGADAVGQRELADDWPAAAELWIDGADAAHVGDLAAWNAARRVERPPRLLLDAWSAELPAQRRVLLAGGSALFDALTLRYLLPPEP